MKKNYTIKKAIFALLVMLGLNAGAQISGIVTINSAAPTAGTNYQTFTALAAVLNTSGINGPLTVNVVASSGPYIEQVNFNQTTGISATNTITINGNNCTLQFNATAAASPHTLMFSGADYITVNNLNVIGLGATYALAGHLWGGADNNTFNNCTFSVSLSTTGTSQVPFSISGSGTSATASGNSGNSNTANSCTMSGGYYNTTIYGSTTAPFNTNNRILNCNILDYYVYGIYHAYAQGTIIKGNIVERMNRLSTSTCYGIILTTGSINGCVVEGNHVRRLFNLIPASTNVTYCLYLSAASTATAPNIVRNNIVSDINSNGSTYGIYLPSASYAQVYHNTLSLDDQTATSGLVYGIYMASTNNSIVRNNIVSVTKTGSGVKYCIYASSISNITLNNNDYYFTPSSSSSNLGFLTSAYNTLSTWQNATGHDFNSFNVDPAFTNTATMNFAPTNLTINNMATPLGLANDFYNSGRSLATPDPGAIEFYTVSCTSAPGANSAITPTAPFCPGMTANINVATTYSNAGFTYQWVSSTVSLVGPFTAIPGATLATYTTAPLTQNVYYSAIITCTPTNQNITATSGLITVAGISYSNIPYYESFESLGPNKLPNCSWSAPSLGGTSLTQTVSNNGGRIPRTGNNFASFFNSPATVNYFYTNGLNLKAGVTYSASLWYITDLINSTNWTDLSIMVGTSQTPGGLVTIASTNGPAASPNHKSLSNTFTVATTGVYYVAVRGTATPGSAAYLSWDDLLIEVPCNLNEPNMTISTNYTTACSGAPFTMNVMGANTYTWSNGSTTSGITVIPSPSTTAYSVMGTSTLSGCTKTVTQPILVSLSPQVSIFSGNSQVCIGKSLTLTAVGAANYNWSNGSNNASTVVSPTATTTYSVIGINAAGCSTTVVQQITVNPNPVVNASGNTANMCVGESVTLTATGAQNYQWSSSPSSILFGNPIVVSPTTSQLYAVTGTDNKGCSGVTSVILDVNECTGINEQNALAGLNVYPNPSKGIFIVEFNKSISRLVEVTDVTGRLVLSQKADSDKFSFDLSNVSKGVYLIKITSADGVNMTRVIKQD
ncbi:MAG: T9SS type A sorting domain-containing protein [Bacteroidia bacterium]|nr:T9SS type A sorting domain-containing protein [Bacteroidia bacterium]